MEAELQVQKIISAPVQEGAELGELRLSLYGETVYRAPLIALTDVPEAGMFSRLVDFVVLFFKQLLE
jgi:D-alanyl-D-alanine carboxypeptidase (penicillin-binding protein 5/6)